MRSGQGRKSFAAWSFLLAATLVSVGPIALHAANKPKPEIPLGEETFEPTPAPKKNTKTEPHAAEKKDAAAPVKPSTDEKKDSTSQVKPHAATDASHEESHEKDPHAAPPAEHGETGTEGKSKESDHGDAKSPHAESASPEKKPSLLEGKVSPATPAKGSGFVWFGVIFVVLAIAIFIFT
ncbi:MAG: hypothetical protein RI932_837 [Pseudomonadota bacterium]